MSVIEFEKFEKDVLCKIKDIEKDIKELQDKINKKEIIDTELKGKIEALQLAFHSLKEEVLTTIKDHTDRTWKLIDRMLKIITGLILVILIIVGIKIGPELLKLLWGV